jgi:hypothetical protein
MAKKNMIYYCYTAQPLYVLGSNESLTYSTILQVELFCQPLENGTKCLYIIRTLLKKGLTLAPNSGNVKEDGMLSTALSPKGPLIPTGHHSPQLCLSQPFLQSAELPEHG